MAQQPSSDLSGYVTLANGYWKHGLGQNDGTVVLLGIDYGHHSGLFVGGWAATVDFATEFFPEQPREIEANAYVGYERRAAGWSWALMFGRYDYPDTAVSYAYNELSATIGFRDRVFYTASYSDSYYSRPRSALNQEVSAVLPLPRNFEVGAALGEFKLSGGGADITHWNVGVSKLVGRAAVDLRYHNSNHARPSLLGDPDADHYVLSVSYALRGRRPRI
jgi:uncharacterized protein (TIGR02001 family)